MPDNEKYRDYWLQTAQADFETMHIMLANKQYHWTLFIGHLLIEKTLKAIYVMQNDEPLPKIHDLSRLAELSGIKMNEEIKEKLDMITTFNISARYPDYKNRFYQTCNKEYTGQQVKIIEELYKWLLTCLKYN